MDPAADSALTIDPAPPRNPGLDYALLKKEGTALVQRFAGAIWTDYNEHDPGVTTLEQLCYALTELSYRAELPLRDLLTRRRSGRIDARRQALYPARSILSCNPLTAGDYRKLLVDRVHDVRNAWLRPLPEAEVDGLYEIGVYASGEEQCPPDPAQHVVERVRRVYGAHRSLCEDLGAVVVLRPLRVVVRGILSVGDGVVPERVLARALFQLGLFLAPEPRRRSLKSLLDAGRTPDEIFVGPLLRQGFIDDDQLQPKADCIGVQEIVRVLTRTPGVRGVRGVEVEAGGAPVGQAFRVGPDEIPRLDARPTGGTGYSLRLVRNGVAYEPDAAQVERELARLWADWRRPRPLAPQYRELLAFPRGQARDVRRYTSIQDQYPNVYGINANGLPQDAPPARQAQARQLKGYLLAFEQLLADFFAQLSRARDLFSLDPDLRRTYFFQSLARSVPNVAPLLRPDYRRNLARLVRSQDDFLERRNRFLDVLLALYGEQLEPGDVSEFGPRGDQDAQAGERLLRAKLELLRHLVPATANRARAFDYLRAPSARNIAGTTIKTRIQLGFEPFPRPLLDLLDECALRLVGSAERAGVGRPLTRQRDHVERHFRPLRFSATTTSTTGDAPWRGQAVTEGLLRAAARRDAFRVGTLPGDREVALVCRAAAGDEWRLVGKYEDAGAAARAACGAAAMAEQIERRCGQVYVVEHLLLRWAREVDHAQDVAADGTCPPPPHDDFVYSFTATFVIAAPARLRRDAGWRRFAREVARANAPAHVALDFVFLSACALCRFERLYWSWRHALREGHAGRRARACVRLRNFLQRHTRRTRRATEA